MKVKRVEYLHDTFTDYDGNQRPVTMCAVSTVVEECDLPTERPFKMLTLGVAIGHPNDKDVWSNEKGEMIALNKATNLNSKKTVPMIITNTPGLISTEMVNTLLKKEMEYFKKSPGTYIAGYNDAEQKHNEKIVIESNFREVLSKTQIEDLTLSQKESILDIINNGKNN